MQRNEYIVKIVQLCQTFWNLFENSERVHAWTCFTITLFQKSSKMFHTVLFLPYIPFFAPSYFMKIQCLYSHCSVFHYNKFFRNHQYGVMRGPAVKRLDKETREAGPCLGLHTALNFFQNVMIYFQMTKQSYF